MKFSWKSYYKPTPKRLRVFGDTLLSTAMIASTFSVFMEKNTVAITIAIIGCLGKFVSNFFTEGEDCEPELNEIVNDEKNEIQDIIFNKDDKLNKHISTRVSYDVFKKIKNKARNNKITISQYVRYLLYTCD